MAPAASRLAARPMAKVRENPGFLEARDMEGRQEDQCSEPLKVTPIQRGMPGL